MRCGCALTSTPADSGEINGYFPTINVLGSGQPGDPWNLTLDGGWAAQVANSIGAWGPITDIAAEADFTATMTMYRAGPFAIFDMDLERTGSSVSPPGPVLAATIGPGGRGPFSAFEQEIFVSTSPLGGITTGFIMASTGEVSVMLGNTWPTNWVLNLNGIIYLGLDTPPGGGGGGGGLNYIQPTTPVAPSVNDLWLDTTDFTLYIYYDDGNSTQWVAIS